MTFSLIGISLANLHDKVTKNNETSHILWIKTETSDRILSGENYTEQNGKSLTTGGKTLSLPAFTNHFDRDKPEGGAAKDGHSVL